MTRHGDAARIFNSRKSFITAKTTFIFGVVKSHPISIPPFVDLLHAIDAVVAAFSHLNITNKNDLFVLREDVSMVIPYVPCDHPPFMVGNVASF